MSTEWKDSEEAKDWVLPFGTSGRWVCVTARIRFNETGEVRDYTSSEVLPNGDAMPDAWMWTDGNYGCDCNRALFFGYAAGLKYDDMPDRECTEGEYSVQLVNPVDGVVYYNEFKP